MSRQTRDGKGQGSGTGPGRGRRREGGFKSGQGRDSGQRERRGSEPMEIRARPPKGVSKNSDQLEGRNVVIEVLRREKRRVHRIWMDERAQSDAKVDEIVETAEARQIQLDRMPRPELEARSLTGAHNGVLAWAEPHQSVSLREVLDRCYSLGKSPFIVLVDEVNYEHNLGAVLRSAMGAGVHAVVVPVRRGKGLTAVVQRVAMGGAEEVPLIREGLSSVLAVLRREGVRVVGADMGGEAFWTVPMTGPLALVLGGEHKGLSPALKKRCDTVVAVPLEGGLDSLNVSVTAGILLFERVRQESMARLLG